jgi:hypothetical protein
MRVRLSVLLCAALPLVVHAQTPAPLPPDIDPVTRGRRHWLEGVHWRMGLPTTLALALLLVAAQPANAQRVPFERSLDAAGLREVAITTERGTIRVTDGEPGRIVVAGTVSVRVGWNVPANAVEIAEGVAGNPPIERDGQTIRLTPPVGRAERRAVTVHYDVRVPPGTRVVTTTDSGATEVLDISGPVEVRTQSAAISLQRLGATVAVVTGSGAVTADDIAGALTVTTSSSAFTGRALRASLHVRTDSGAIDASLSGPGDVNVQTGSSAIRVHGLRGGLSAVTRSGRVSVDGAPAAPWTVSTGSGAVALDVSAVDSLSVEASSGSGSVTVRGATVRGVVEKRRVSGTIGAGGPPLRATSRSGSVTLDVAPAVRDDTP